MSTFTQSILIMAPTLALMFTARHLLTSLIILETITLSSIVIIPMTMLPNSPSEIVSLLTLLSVSACEASIALGCFICLIRSYGNDKMLSLHSLSM